MRLLTVCVLLGGWVALVAGTTPTAPTTTTPASSNGTTTAPPPVAPVGALGYVDQILGYSCSIIGIGLEVIQIRREKILAKPLQLDKLFHRAAALSLVLLAVHDVLTLAFVLSSSDILWSIDWVLVDGIILVITYAFYNVAFTLLVTCMKISRLKTGFNAENMLKRVHDYMFALQILIDVLLQTLGMALDQVFWPKLLWISNSVFAVWIVSELIYASHKVHETYIKSYKQANVSSTTVSRVEASQPSQAGSVDPSTQNVQAASLEPSKFDNAKEPSKSAKAKAKETKAKEKKKKKKRTAKEKREAKMLSRLTALKRMAIFAACLMLVEMALGGIVLAGDLYASYWYMRGVTSVYVLSTTKWLVYAAVYVLIYKSWVSLENEEEHNKGAIELEDAESSVSRSELQSTVVQSTADATNTQTFAALKVPVSWHVTGSTPSTPSTPSTTSTTSARSTRSTRSINTLLLLWELS